MGKFYSVKNTSGSQVLSGSLTIADGATRELYLEDDAVAKFRQVGTAEEDNSIESAVDVNGMMQNNPNVTKKKGKSTSTETKDNAMSTPKDETAGDPNATQQQPVNSSGPNVTAPGAGGPTVTNPTPDDLTPDSTDGNDGDDKANADKSTGKDTAKASDDKNSKKK